MSKQIILYTSPDISFKISLEDEQDIASLEEDLMEAAKTGAVVSVTGNIGRDRDKKETIYINPSRALLWEIKDVSNPRIGSAR